MSETVELLKELVSIGSVNPMGRGLTGPEIGEARLTEFLEAYFERIGVRCYRQDVLEGRQNVVAHHEVAGAKNTVVLEAHQDTVPADNMTIDPFDPKVEDGKLYGRGSCDTKAGMAAMLVALKRVVVEQPAGAASVIMVCSVDEECQFSGVLRYLRDPCPATMAIVAEPTDLTVVIAHKGVVRWTVRAPGRSAHSAHPEQGVNAIYRMARVVTAMQQYADQLTTLRTHPLLGTPTISVGMIRGGTSVNTVPASCEIEVDRRTLPGEDPLDAHRAAVEFLRERAGLGFTPEVTDPWLADPALDTPRDAPVVHLAEQAVRDVTGRAEVGGVHYGTDASKLAHAGIPSVVLGPGDIAQAHGPVEFVDIAQVDQAAQIYYRMICVAG